MNQSIDLGNLDLLTEVVDTLKNFGNMTETVWKNNFKNIRFGGGPKVGTLSRRVGAGEVFIKKDLCTYLPLDVRDTVTPFIIISTRMLPISPT